MYYLGEDREFGEELPEAERGDTRRLGHHTLVPQGNH